jgi:hypothetical protein
VVGFVVVGQQDRQRVDRLLAAVNVQWRQAGRQ